MPSAVMVITATVAAMVIHTATVVTIRTVTDMLTARITNLILMSSCIRQVDV